MNSKIIRYVSFLLLCLPLLVWAQDLESVDAMLNTARRSLINIEFQKCIESSDNAMTLLPEDLYDYYRAPQVKNRIVKALEYRGVARYNLGQFGDAEADFQKLLGLSPGHKLSEEFASARIISLFEKIRRAMVGSLSLTSTPAGAVVFHEERVLGQTNMVNLPMVAGEYNLKLQLPGYQEKTIKVSITHGKVSSASVDLARTEASLSLRTYPSGAEVYLDGKLIGTTTGRAPEKYRELAVSAGLELSEVSSDFVVNRIPLGTHKLELRKSCYETRVIRLPEITSAIDYDLPQIFIIDREVGRLELNSIPTGAQVYLNRSLQKSGMKSFPELCAGVYHLEVISRAGRFSTEVVIKKNETTTVSVTARPGMLMISSLLNSNAQNSRYQRLRSFLNQFKEQLTSFSILKTGEAGSGGELGRRAILRQLRAVKIENGIGRVPENLFRIIKAALIRKKARLLTVIEPEIAGGQPRLRIYIFNDLVPYCESVAITNNGKNSLKNIIRRLNDIPVIEEAWIGITAVDTRLFDSPVIIEIQKNSPAARVGFELKSRIVSANNSKITSVKQFKDLARQWHPGESASLVLNFGNDTSKNLLLEYSPLLIPEHDPDILYNVVIAHMGTSLEGANKDVARFNTAISLMHFGAFEEASLILRGLRLGAGPGINQGTVFFYLGKCFEGMGSNSQALESYMKAGSIQNATLVSHNGPLLKFEALSKIKKLGSR